MNDYRELLQELLRASVRFLVVGGYATIAHGITRATDDLDIWIEPTLENARRVLEALAHFGVANPELTVETIADPSTFFRVGEESGLKVDFMADAGGSDTFAHAWPNRFETEFLGVTVPFLGLRDLLAMKKRVGRHKDLADAESLIAFHRLTDVDPE